jgi:capsid protein
MATTNKQATTVVDNETSTRRKIYSRLFTAALARNTLDFTESRSINADIQAGLDRLRGRARSLSVNNEYARSLLRLMKTSVVGAKGVLLTPQSKKTNGELEKEQMRY